MVISDIELENMARFFLKKLYNGIPYIPTAFASEERLGDMLGMIEYTEGDNYILENDKLLKMHEYDFKETGLGNGVFIENTYEPSFMDPENAPKIECLISDTLKDNVNMTTGILLHELCHYWCWYRGYEHHDGDMQFERKLKELKLPSSSDMFYDKELERHIPSFDFNRMSNYVEMYHSNM